MSLKTAFRVGGELVDEENVSRRDRMQLAELLGQALLDLQNTVYNLTGGVATVDIDANLVLHGASVPSDLTNAELHRNLTGADLHEPKPHKASHVFGGSDAFAWPDELSCSSRGLRETAGPTQLEMGAVAANQVLQRVGAFIVGLTLGAGATANFTDNEDLTPTLVGATLTCANAPDPADSLMLFTRSSTADPFTSGWMLLIQDAAEQYTLAGDTITLLAGAPPAGTEYRAWYRH